MRKRAKQASVAACLGTVAVIGLFVALPAGGAGPVGFSAQQESQSFGAGPVEVTVTGVVEFNGISESPLSDVSFGDSASMTFLVDSGNFVDGAGNTRGYVIDPSSFILSFESGVVTQMLLNPFPPGETPYFTLADGIPVADRFWVSTSVNSPGGVPVEQEPFEANVDLGYVGETLSSLDILDALGTYDFDGLTSFGFNLWAIFPDNVVLGIDFEQMTIAGGECGTGGSCPDGLECVTECGELVQGVECVLFLADSGGLFLLENLGGFNVGDQVEVTGCLDPGCFTICLEGDGCIFQNTIEDCVEDDMITICHIPPGNHGNAHTITISINALPAHLAHGDTIGPCGNGARAPVPSRTAQ